MAFRVLMPCLFKRVYFCINTSFCLLLCLLLSLTAYSTPLTISYMAFPGHLCHPNRIDNNALFPGFEFERHQNRTSDTSTINRIHCRQKGTLLKGTNVSSIDLLKCFNWDKRNCYARVYFHQRDLDSDTITRDLENTVLKLTIQRYMIFGEWLIEKQTRLKRTCKTQSSLRND